MLVTRGRVFVRAKKVWHRLRRFFTPDCAEHPNFESYRDISVKITSFVGVGGGKLGPWANESGVLGGC